MAKTAEPTDEIKKRVVEEINSDPCDFFEINPAQDRFVKAISNIKPDTLNIVFFLKGNGVGGTFELVRCWSAIMFGTKNPRFQCPPFAPQWPFGSRKKSARVVSTIDALADKGALQIAMRNLFPVGKWSQKKSSGKPYNSEGETDTGWDWDCKTYDQDPQQAASATKGLMLFSEPPPYPMFTECCTRLRGSGLILIDMTQLDLAGWAEDLVDAEKLVLDGTEVGNVSVVRGDVEDNCRDHHPPDSNNILKPCGQRSHVSIQADIALWPPEEREARKTGRPLHLAGRIYQNWSEVNEITKLDKFHQECWDKNQIVISNIVNPHDRPPWPIVWIATFPNDDAIAFAEWPPFSWHECKSSPVTHYEDYRGIILETEAEIGMPIKNRIMDPLFGEAINTQTGFNLFNIMSGKCLNCNRQSSRRSHDNARDEEKDKIEGRCQHSLLYRHGIAYPGSVNAGHMLVRAAIGDPAKGIRPKFYALKESCPNLCYAMRRYAFRENKDKTKGQSDRPQFINKEVADLPRLFYLSKLDKYPAETIPQEQSLWGRRMIERNQR